MSGNDLAALGPELLTLSSPRMLLARNNRLGGPGLLPKGLLGPFAALLQPPGAQPQLQQLPGAARLAAGAARVYGAVTRHRVTGTVDTEVIVYFMAHMRELRVDLLSLYSGHYSFGMYCMLFLALYVQARLCWKWARLLRPTFQFFLVAFAIYVGYTRVSDHKHHWSDVLVGLLQGALVACLTVRYVSDFFKSRPPQPCQEGEEPERKPSLSLTLTLGDRP
ncbi:phospholipid phosphatase 2-like [Apodemus sylvaticus]|uniref:phospholipid phosphatase 2-like n=1 Tax=Apodemus sylvaticus TaxID=10129 RepID=UPI0022439BDB|nr:phospholipid phosphatase 2-like [Apodemus sylvaticus]